MLEKMKKIFSADKYAHHNGIKIIDAGEGYAETKMDLKDFHVNGMNFVHGAVIFLMADYTFAVAANSRNNISVATNVYISFIRPGTGRYLTAKASEESCGKTLATYCIDIFNDEGKVIAKCHATAYRYADKKWDE